MFLRIAIVHNSPDFLLPYTTFVHMFKFTVSSPSHATRHFSHTRFTHTSSLSHEHSSSHQRSWLHAAALQGSPRHKKYVDVTFVVEGQPMPAHRLILASQSDYFDLLFYGKMREANSSDEMPLPNAPLEALRLLLEFMYSGCLDYDNQPLQVSVLCHVDW